MPVPLETTARRLRLLQGLISDATECLSRPESASETPSLVTRLEKIALFAKRVAEGASENLESEESKT